MMLRTAIVAALTIVLAGCKSPAHFAQKIRSELDGKCADLGGHQVQDRRTGGRVTPPQRGHWDIYECRKFNAVGYSVLASWRVTTANDFRGPVSIIAMHDET